MKKAAFRRKGLRLQTKSYSPPEGGRIAFSANERIDEFLDFAIQAKFAYVNKLGSFQAKTAESGKTCGKITRRR